MKRLLLVLRVLVTVLGGALLLLGVLFWTGHLLPFVRVHMAIGGIFVLCLWALAACALMRRIHVLLAVLVVAWGVIVLLLGMYQTGILPGRGHWIVQILHLLVGGAAIGFGQRLGRGMQGAQVTWEDHELSQ